jgi:hypothetical protein
VTTFWVSWNGATDVAEWRFYAQASEFHDPVFIGKTPRSDFETMYIARGYLDWVSAEAVDVNGTVLGRSEMHRSKSPDWKSVGYRGKSTTPIPVDPSIMYQASDSATDDNAVNESNRTSSDAVDTQTQKTTQILKHTYDAIRSISGIFSFVLLLCVFVGVMACYMVIRGWRVRVYQRLATEDGLPGERAHLASPHED